MKGDREPGLATRCVHAPGGPDSEGGLHPPLYNHTTFAFPDTSALQAVVAGAPGNFYTRYGSNPTILAVEAHLAAIEGAERALVFSSGIAAIGAALLATAGPHGEIVCAGDVYGGTYELLSSYLPDLGVNTRFVLPRDLADLPRAFSANTRVLYLETPTNPLLAIHDIAALSALAKAHGVCTVVDGTFATPVLQRPLALGADLVVHSATKYLGGHSDLTGGVVCGGAGALDVVWRQRKILGSILAPEAAFLLSRSLKTLTVRVRAQSASALTLAQRLQSHPRIAAVHYPGLPTHPGHDVACRQMSAFGAMITVELRGDARAAARVIDHLRWFATAASLGGVESLATQPITTTHHGMTQEERLSRGITDGMIRLSVGLEDVEDLWADLVTTLDA